MTQATNTDRHSSPGFLTTSTRDLSAAYPVWLCDVWGVVHDGITASPGACKALAQHRCSGGTVILITNAPRPSSAIVPQLDEMGVSHDCYDAIVSSGDVTRRLVELQAGRNVYHLGPAKDLALIDDLPVKFTSPDDAEILLCSGLIDDEAETPDDYREQLRKLCARGLPMICANPDRVVRKGNKLLPCAGALAAIYEEFGGSVAMAGKPFAPIYEECLRLAAKARNAEIVHDQVLAIGDGLPTDAKGAAKFGIALLFIIDGIHEQEMAGGSTSALEQMVVASAPGVRIASISQSLEW